MTESVCFLISMTTVHLSSSYLTTLHKVGKRVIDRTQIQRFTESACGMNRTWLSPRA